MVAIVRTFAAAAAILVAPVSSNGAKADVIVKNDSFGTITCGGETLRISQLSVLCPRGHLVNEATVVQFNTMARRQRDALLDVCGFYEPNLLRPNVASAINAADRLQLDTIAASANSHFAAVPQYLKTCAYPAATLHLIEAIGDLYRMKSVFIAAGARASQEFKDKLPVTILDQIDEGLADMSGSEGAAQFTGQAINPDDYEMYLKMYPKIFEKFRQWFGVPNPPPSGSVLP